MYKILEIKSDLIHGVKPNFAFIGAAFFKLRTGCGQ